MIQYNILCNNRIRLSKECMIFMNPVTHVEQPVICGVVVVVGSALLGGRKGNS